MTVLSSNEVESLKQRVEGLLKQRCGELRLPFSLSIVGSSQEAEWTYFVVQPDKEQVRIYDYAEVLSEVETALRRDQHIENVLLVPAIPD